MKRMQALAGEVLFGLTACQAPTQSAQGRDWQATPAIVDLAMTSPLYALSDIHGGYDRLAALLAQHLIIQKVPASPSAVKWAAGPSTLVVAGDLVDKGPNGVEVLDLLRALETSASAAGGRVVVLLGNHEAEFLVDPRNDKALALDGIAAQLSAIGIDIDAVARGTEPRGQWLRSLPFAARIGRWFFSHAGDTHGRTLAELDSALRIGVDSYDYNHPEIVGETSLLESSGWTSGDKSIGARYAAAVGAAHIVFGHDPGALGDRGEIEDAQSGSLFRIDCGMSPNVNYSPGAIFRIEEKGGQEIASALLPSGQISELWRGDLP